MFSLLRVMGFKRALELHALSVVFLLKPSNVNLADDVYSAVGLKILIASKV